ncbi:MAG: M23 family metallopeptidase [Rhodobacteraceae bacterium]|nr:M23 family metallopeptidase [Paracoccaceae bacterium]
MKPFFYTSRVLALLLCGLFGSNLTGHAQAQEPVLEKADGSPVIHGAKSKPRRARLCSDYGSTRSYTGHPYRVVEKTRIVKRHEGIDFCHGAGKPVLSPVDGRVEWMAADNPLFGGFVIVRANFNVRPRPGKKKGVMYFGMVHINPLPGLRPRTKVKAGQLVGHVRRTGPVEIGPRSHVHFVARVCADPIKCHVDPNFFWRDGPGRVSCYDPSVPVPKGRIVAPVAC